MNTIKGVCEFEDLAPLDLASALENLKGHTKSRVTTTPPGLGPRRLLDWALVDIEAAHLASEEEATLHFATNAVLNARRALACFVEWQIANYGLSMCRNAPRKQEAKVELLLQLGFLDRLSWSVMQRSVALRNIVEHEFERVLLTDAEVAVDTIRRNLESAFDQWRAHTGPAIYGSFGRRHNHAKGVDYYSFHGWSDPCVVVFAFVVPAWLGVVIPSSQERAVVRRVELSQLSCQELLAAYSMLETQFRSPDYPQSQSMSAQAQVHVLHQCVEAGLLPPHAQ